MRVSILGVTGTVGQAALSVVQAKPEQFKVSALSAGRNIKALLEAAHACRPEFVALADAQSYADLKEALAGTGIACGAGDAAVCEAAARESDRVVCAISGYAGLEPSMAAIGAGKIVALANKEALVCAGPLMLDAIAKANASLIPIDSEHNAIFQALDQSGFVERLVLTASGGPFRNASYETMQQASPEQACKHPNWQMGPKISVDSATMMNKALELIEAVYLFDIPPERIDILIHPQSIIHGMVTYKDGSVLAQLSSPDMRVPIAHALAWPQRLSQIGVKPLDLAQLGQLDFAPLDTQRFPAPNLARLALQAGPAGPLILSTANELAVAAFLERRMALTDIVPFAGELMQEILSQHADSVPELTDLEQVKALIDTVNAIGRKKLT